MLKEIAVGDLMTAKLAFAKGIDRIELNQHLELGGLTPSRSDWQAVLKLGCPLVVMVRPRAGDFNYNHGEVREMEDTLSALKEDGVQMVTFGALNDHLRLDTQTMQHLIQLAAPMRVVMHMAFDEIPFEHQANALDWLVEHQVERILTHGGPLTQPIEKSLQHLKETVSLAQDKIEILPGGGINFNNYEKISYELGVNQVHGSQIIDLNA